MAIPHNVGIGGVVEDGVFPAPEQRYLVGMDLYQSGHRLRGRKGMHEDIVGTP